MEILMTFNRFKVDENFRAVGDPIYTQVRGSTDDEVNALLQELRRENEVTKYTPYNFVRLDIL